MQSSPAGASWVSDGRHLWTGGYFGVNGAIDSLDYGTSADDSGYHGLTLCQRTADGVSSVNWVARSSFLDSVINGLPEEFSPGLIATALSLRASAFNKRVLYSPFNLMQTRLSIVRPAEPDDDALRMLGFEIPSTSRYYNSKLAVEFGFQWIPKYQVL